MVALSVGPGGEADVAALAVAGGGGGGERGGGRAQVHAAPAGASARAAPGAGGGARGRGSVVGTADPSGRHRGRLQHSHARFLLHHAVVQSLLVRDLQLGLGAR